MHPYLAHLRGQKSVNNYQSQKSALGQTIVDQEAQGEAQKEAPPGSQGGQGPRLGAAIRPSVRPPGPALSKMRQQETEGLSPGGEGWSNTRPAEGGHLADRPSDLRDEIQPYYMRSPFGVARATQERDGADRGAAAGRAQAAKQYGLVQYAQLGTSPTGKRLRRPGTGLGGGIGIRKLSKLDAKEQDEVNEVTEDEDRVSPLLPAASGREALPPQTREQRPALQSARPFYPTFTSSNTNPDSQRASLRESSPDNAQRATQNRKAYTFGQPRTDSSAHRAQQPPPKVLDQVDPRDGGEQLPPNAPHVEEQEDANQLLREEYLKVRRELEMLKRTAR